MSDHEQVKASQFPPWKYPTRGVLSKLPPSWVPFAELSRIEKPGGLYGVYMAYVLGLGYGSCIASPAVPSGKMAYTMAVLLVYNVFHRGAACTINDFFDRDFDRQVARCSTRPIARGAVAPKYALAWYCAQVVGTAIAIAWLPNPRLALFYAGWSPY